MPLPLQLLSLVTVVVVIAVVTGAVASAAVIVHTKNILTATADTPFVMVAVCLTAGTLTMTSML